MSESFDPRAPSLVVPVTIIGPRERYTFRCTLDTGSARTVLPALYLRRLGFDLSQPAGYARLRTATGTTRAPLVRVPAVTALGRVRPNLVVAAHDLPLGVETDGLLGLDFFRGWVLKLDFARGHISLAPPRRWWPFWQQREADTLASQIADGFPDRLRAASRFTVFGHGPEGSLGGLKTKSLRASGAHNAAPAFRNRAARACVRWRFTAQSKSPHRSPPQRGQPCPLFHPVPARASPADK